MVTFSAVIFDLDDTLVEEEQTARRSFREVAERLQLQDPSQSWKLMRDAVRTTWHGGPHHDLCLSLGIASWEGLWATFEGNHPVLDGVKAWIPSYRREAWRGALAAVELTDPELIAVAQETYVSAQSRGHPLLGGADQSVRHVSTRCRLALLTNGPSDIQRHKLSGTGLEPHFECLAISGETGVGKPTPAAFARVLSCLGVEPQDAVMIGDSWERDVRGAVTLGMSAVWIASGRPVPERIERVNVIDAIADLSDALD